jgi:hypothetical protein
MNLKKSGSKRRPICSPKILNRKKGKLFLFRRLLILEDQMKQLNIEINEKEEKIKSIKPSIL